MAAVVTISDGTLEGAILDNVLGGKYYSFKGIPYAAPPLGDLRFKAPQPPIPWEGVKSVKQHGNVFHQHDIFLGKLHDGSEDALFLNVYTNTLNPESPRPVMLFIHGGGFIGGSGDDNPYGPDFLVDKDVVLVTFNYRIEILGFLCLDTEDVPGNAGMKDQVAAMRWIQKNIKHFGGDPNNVTIFGLSAGSSSVAFHLVSPMSKGLFKRAIMQSGTCTNTWAMTYEPKERAIAFARHLGKDTRDVKELYEFFKSEPYQSFRLAKGQITFAELGQPNYDMYFNVVSESKFNNQEAFFTGDIYDVYKSGIHKDVDIILGTTRDEGIIGMFLIPPENVLKYNDYFECFVPNHLRRECSIKDQLVIGRKFKEYYYKDERITMDNLLPLIKYLTFEMFAYDTIQLARACVKKNTKVYLYKFTGQSERNIFKQLCFGPEYLKDLKDVVSHADDSLHLFHTIHLPQVDKTAPSYRIIDNITKLWTNFAKYGNPTPREETLGDTWVPYNDGESYLDINEILTLKYRPDHAELELWDSIFRKYLPKARVSNVCADILYYLNKKIVAQWNALKL